MRRPRSHLLLAALAATASLAALPTSSGAHRMEPAEFRLCGTKPGQEPGAYSFVKAWNMRCKRARKVASEAYDRFCDPVERCSIDPDTGEPIRGRVEFRAWECKLRLAYEFSRIRCEHPDRFLIQESGA